MINASVVTPHMEVVGSDGKHVGKVDHLAIKLMKNDQAADGKHHVLSIEMADKVHDGKLMLNVSAAEAMAKQKALTE